MNIRSLLFQSLRTYSTRRFRKSVNPKFKVIKPSETENESEEFIEEDVSAYESDFMNVAESHIDYEREMEMAKKQLQQQITKSKYFKETEPRFLTYMEKEEIIKLHESNPEEWTPERLSNSFPVLPETISRLLKSKWEPQKVESIIKYDEKAIENWRNFKMGRLAVGARMREHLMKFRNRRIVLASREKYEELMPPKVVFPKPRSSVFSNLIKDYIEEKQPPVSDEKLLSARSDIKEEKKAESSENAAGEKSLSLFVEGGKRDKSSKQGLTFDEFIKKEMKQLYQKSPEVGVTLLDTYRNYVNSLEAQSEAKELETVREKPEEKSIADRLERKSKVEKVSDSARNFELDTYVKERKCDIDTECEYAKPIKIPKNQWVKGKTYRVNDCYYDDDGEFLFRTPELR